MPSQHSLTRSQVESGKRKGGGAFRLPLSPFPSFLGALSLLLLPALSAAQNRFITAGDKAYDALAYTKAIASYERAVEKAVPDTAYARKLAKSYLNVRNFKHAEIWYARAVSLPTVQAEDYYNYAQTLRANGKFGEADKWLRTYELKDASDSRAQRQANASTYATQLRDRVIDGCIVKDLDMNTTGADMGASFQGKDGVVFASDRSPRSHEWRRHAWNGQPFLDLYRGVRAADGTITTPTSLSAMNTRYHESNAAFSADGNTVWFTRNNFHQGKKGMNGEGVVNLKIFSRELQNGIWINEQPFPFNSDEYSVGHPCLSVDGNALYFTSDKPGGAGGTDIWRTVRSGTSWGTPTPLGSEINTEGDEMFPFIGTDGTFAFSSDGHPGLGGHDILVGRMSADGIVKGVKNRGAPLNSGHDDFALGLDSTLLNGYFTSDRSGGKGGDDIWSLTLTRPLGIVMQVGGTAMDRLSQQPLEGVKVRMKDEQGNLIADTLTDANGNYLFDVEEYAGYEISSEVGSYRDATVRMNTAMEADTTYAMDLLLARKVEASLWMHVTSAKDGAALSGVHVEVEEATGGARLMNDTTDTLGDRRSALVDRAAGDTLAVTVRLVKAGYFPERGFFRHTIDKDGEIAVHHTMDLSMEPMEVGVDVGKAISINPIYFDLGKNDIRPDAAAELDKVVAVMNENPTMEIELGSHTDSRGSNAANRSLSEKRAKSSAAYIISKGIEKGRIKGKGYGESVLLNECGDRAKCSEEEHQLNRRTEFVITKM